MPLEMADEHLEGVEAVREPADAAALPPPGPAAGVEDDYDVPGLEEVTP